MAEGQGRSSGQGVKLLYIRDYLYTYTDKEHPKNAKDIKEFLASKGIKASEKTIYNDIFLYKFKKRGEKKSWKRLVDHKTVSAETLPSGR